MKDDAFRLLRNLASRDNRRVSVVLILSGLLIIAWYYVGSAEFYQSHLATADSPRGTYACLYEVASTVVLLALIPIACLRWIWGESLEAFGLGPGLWRRWLPVFAATIPLFLVVAWYGSSSAGLRLVYPRDPHACDDVTSFVLYAAARFFFYFAWEIHFRGFVQYGLAPSMGREPACLVQALSCSLAHLGGPYDETIGALVGGLWWGAHAFCTRSVWGTTLQHWFLGISMEVLICAAG